MVRRALASIAALAAAVAVVLWALPRTRSVPPPQPVAPATAAATLSGSTPGALVGTRYVARTPPVRLVAPVGAPASAPASSGAFEGRVISGSGGSPIPGAQLTFARAEEASSVAAGPDGAFRFEARAPGRWFLAAVTAAGFQPFAPAWGASPVSLEARPNEVVRGVNVTLAPEVRRQGLVIDEAGGPVAGAEVRVLGDRGADAIVALADRFTSDAAGRFTFSLPDDVILEARKEGVAPGRARVDYSVRVTGRLTIRLVRPSGPILIIEGVVEDAAGAPIAGATVTGQARERADESAARSGVNGAFRLEGLAPGTWWLVAERPGFAAAAAAADAGATGVRLRLRAGGRIEGRVRDHITARPVTEFTILVQAVVPRHVSIVDPDGRYAIEDLTPGAAALSLVAPGYAMTPIVDVTVPEPGAAPAVVDFDLAPGGRVVGTVLSRGSRRPISRATVEVEGMASSLGMPVRTAAVSGDDGRFQLVGVGEESMSLFASAPGHHARVLSVPGVPGGGTSTPIEIELTPLTDGEEPRVELAGIGAVLTKEGDTLRVVKVIAGGGAAEVGLNTGDEIVAVEGASTAQTPMSELMPRLRGPEGTTVTLTVVKSGDAARAPRDVIVPRRLVRG